MRLNHKVNWYVPSDGVVTCLRSRYEWLVREALAEFRFYWQWSYLGSEQQALLAALAELCRNAKSPSIRQEALKILSEITAPEE